MIRPTYDELARRVQRAEAVVEALRSDQVDAVVGTRDVALLRAHRAEQRLRESERRFRLAVDNVPDGFVIYDPQRRIQFVNAAALRLTQRTREELLGRTDAQALPADMASALLPVLDRAIATGEQHESALTFASQGGEPAHFRVTYVPLLHPEGGLQQVLGIWQDVTEATRTRQDLEELADSLERRVAAGVAVAERHAALLRSMASRLTRAEQDERRRLAQLLHDGLQQILVGAKWSLASLRDRLKDTELATMTERLDELLVEAIQVTRSLSVELAPPVLYEAGLPAALSLLAKRFEQQHGLKLHLQVDPEAGPAALSARALLFQAVRELLLNVIKHSQVREAMVTVEQAEGDRCRVIVSDAGAGFVPPPADAEPQPSRTGWGLFSIRERTALLGGEAHIDSAPGRGTRVTLVVPKGEPDADETREVEAEPRESASPAAPAAAARRNGRTRVMLVDDHAIVRDGLAGLFEREEDMVVVGEAADGRAACVLARELRPEVVVMDVSMPEMDGIEATRRIVAELPATCVIGLSMHENAEYAARMCEAGAIGYLRKDGPADALVAAVRACAPQPE